MLSSIYRPLLQQVNTTYCDFKENSKDSVKGCCDTHHTPGNHDREWLLCILPSTLIFREASMCIIELYWPSRFTRQFGYTQSRVGALRLYHMQEASIIDDYRSWVWTRYIRAFSLPVGLRHHGECILRYWEWHAQALRNFLLLRNRPFMSGDLCGIIKKRLKPKHCKDPEELSSRRNNSEVLSSYVDDKAIHDHDGDPSLEEKGVYATQLSSPLAAEEAPTDVKETY